MKNKVIVVTGSSGFIGSHLVDLLEKENPKNIINIDLSSGHDLCNSDKMLELFAKERPDIVFNLAVLPLPASLTEPALVFSKIMYMMLVLGELGRLGLYKRLVHVSSSEAYGSAVYTPQNENHPLNPHTPYASAKACCDLIILSYYKTFGIDVVIPRCFNTYGPRQPIKWGALIPKCVSHILENKPPVIYKNTIRSRDFIYVTDTVKGIIGVAKHAKSGDIVNIGTGIETTIMDMLEKICKMMDYKGEIDYQKERIGDVSKLCADITKAKTMFGFKPEVGLDEGLKKTIDYYKKGGI